LSIYKTDLLDALAYLRTYSSSLEGFVISDYLKNAIITMLNALISEEQIGLFNADDAEYQQVRREFIDLAQLATRAHYQFFFKAHAFALPDNYADRAEFAVSYLQGRSSRRWVRLHAASLSRPEASHPLVIFCASFNIASAYPHAQTIVGLPSGGTELALLITMQYDFLYGRSPNVILLPLSLHSAKDIFGEGKLDKSGLASFLNQYRHSLLDQTVLICDDNSSTGRTLQHAHDVVKPFLGQGDLLCAVAEIDVIRSLLDQMHLSREYVANPVIFEHSINILPVSRRLRPKADIKELMEKQEIIRYHKRHRSSAVDVVESIYRDVIIDVNRHDTTEIIQTSPPASLISNIQGTVLSNFYAIPIPYQGLVYPSVEHAYQHAKFTPAMLKDVDSEALDEIRDVMRLRGYGAPIQDLSALFTDERFNAGNIKLVADVLRKRGYGKDRWPEARVRTMIALHLIKFSDEVLEKSLLATAGRTIIEGNDWNDTLWGYCDGRGRNVLGRILMNIRDRKISKELE